MGHRHGCDKDGAGTPYMTSLLPRGIDRGCCRINLDADVQFYQYLRTGESLRARVAPRGAGAAGPGIGIDPKLPVVVYVHGFGDSSAGTSATMMRKAYFAAGWDVNFVAMDWAPLATFPWYAQAVANSQVAGQALARFLEGLVKDGVSPARTHVVGFSLGAEVAGFAGKNLTKSGIQLGRITGLDPAFPLFRWTREEGHLSSGDAAFVDVIHTDSGVYGVAFPIGDADFFPNGGARQPGCSVREQRARGEMYPGGFSSCSHSRAWQLYAESVVEPTSFPALRCRTDRDFRSGQCGERVADTWRRRLLRTAHKHVGAVNVSVPAAASREEEPDVAFMGVLASRATDSTSSRPTTVFRLPGSWSSLQFGRGRSGLLSASGCVVSAAFLFICLKLIFNLLFFVVISEPGLPTLTLGFCYLQVYIQLKESLSIQSNLCVGLMQKVIQLCVSIKHKMINFATSIFILT
ncbi:Pancreatic lipase-related protein 2 [Frankliniella fusca]|uniref:Pancreatic lipase-related protein 2 n=1 Tax=Frankliniella fusca TaxID=407009 RepID=A0AAE1H9U4_9NEOP|nr:Pancreatic lipase-related protein 2 [Frankliniella fusca]